MQHRTPTVSIRVLVADDTLVHTQLLGEALRREQHFDVTIASSSQDVVQAFNRHSIDVAVISVNLDDQVLHGCILLRQLRSVDPRIRSVFLLDSSKQEIVLQAFRAGARGLFSRHESIETLAKCIRSVHEGQIWANSQQMCYAVEALAALPEVRALDANGLSLLSKRELEVVRCLAEGLTNREIAERLALSQHTVKNYLFRVFEKTGVSNRLELLFMTLSATNERATKKREVGVESSLSRFS
jgi:two-component system, NarL family, nitrate/nitrite response regulator NarL